MRKATAEDVHRHRALSLGDLRYLVPSVHMPTEAKYYLPQVEWNGENVCIRGINVETGEVMIDCGFGRVFWIGEGDPAPIMQFIAYEPSDEERSHRRAGNNARHRADRIGS